MQIKSITNNLKYTIFLTVWKALLNIVLKDARHAFGSCICPPSYLFIMSQRRCVISQWSIVENESVTSHTQTLKTAGESGTLEPHFSLCSGKCIHFEFMSEKRQKERWSKVFFFFVFFSHKPSALPFLFLIRTTEDIMYKLLVRQQQLQVLAQKHSGSKQCCTL